MSAEARMRREPFQLLRSALEDTSWNHDFLVEYVNELSHDNDEEGIFLRMAFRSANLGGSGGASLTPNTVSELYEAMSLEEKTEIRRWWHGMNHCEAYQYDELRTRLSWRFLV